MAARLVRLSMFLLGCFLWLPGAAAAPQNTAPTEPSAPQASPALKQLLTEADRLADAKQPADSLKAADGALEAARQAGDSVGMALAQQSRAEALHDLQRDEGARAAWQEAAVIWARTGDTPEQITTLVQAGLLFLPDKQSEAERLFAQGLAVAKLETQRPLALAQAVHDQGVTLGQKGSEQIAMEYLQFALAMREEAIPESAKLIETLNALAKYTKNYAYRHADLQSGDKYYAIVKGYVTRAVEMSQRVAPVSSQAVEAHEQFADCEWWGENFTGSRQHYREALQIQRQLVPDGSVEEVHILTGFAQTEVELTNYPQAHEYLDQAVVLAERLAPESLVLEGALEGLGNLEGDEGNLSAARYHLERALAIERKHKDMLGAIFVNLGAVAWEQYDFSAARKYYEDAIEQFQKYFPTASGIPFALDGLSQTYYRQGDLPLALEYGQRALAITERQLGEGTDTANQLSAVGKILQAQGKFGVAGDYYRRALEIRMKTVPNSLLVSHSLDDLADLARAKRDLRQATEYERRALDIGQKSCPNLWCVTQVLNSLGELAYEQGDRTGSENFLRRALSAREQGLGPANLNVARTLNSLALTLAAEGKITGALAAALRAERIGAEHLRISARTLSERQALAYESIRASGLDIALTLAADRRVQPPARREVFDAVIHSRALVFDELATRHRSAYGSGDAELIRLADNLSSARARLATLVFRGIGDSQPEVYKRLLDDAREGKEKAERALAEKSMAFRQEEARAQIGLREIKAALPPSAALVAFVRYARHALQDPGAGKTVAEPVPAYAAFVLRAGEPGPQFVALGTAKTIEGLLSAWRRDISRPAEPMEASSIAAGTAYRRSGAALRRSVWDPLLPALGNAREVFVVPDAALHLLNLAALPVGDRRYLVESGPLIHYLSTERDLAPSSFRPGRGILVVGNPAFDRDLVVASNSHPTLVSTTSGSIPATLRSTRSACGTFQSLHFPPLPASQQEVDNIAALWRQARLSAGAASPGSEEMLQVTGANASREAFTQYAPGKRVLHVATHAFFLEGNCESAVQRRLDLGKGNESFLPAAAENPLLLSGLAFAGANRHASAKLDESDGILTAEEIAGLNLEGVDWAVLSACDTGVGEIKVGEGVFGLRRAFQVAGARTVIMSLWPVDDESTRQWMATLYREHFLNAKNTGQSARAASLQILKLRRANGQSTHPFYWAAFVAAGDWH